MLHADGGFRVQVDLAAIDRRLKADALLGNLAQLAQAPDLKTARIGQNRSLPATEVMQVTVGLHHLGARPQHQVKGIPQNNFSANFLDIPRQHALDRAVSAHRHKGRGLYRAATECQLAAPGLAVATTDTERHITLTRHAYSPEPMAESPGNTSMASP